MSDTMSQGLSTGTADASQSQPETLTELTETQITQQSTELQQTQTELSYEQSDLALGVLASIPEEDRDIVAKYIKGWDAGVTRKIQGIHSQYEGFKPFLENGVDPQTLDHAVRIYGLLEENPKVIYNFLKDQFELGEQGPSVENNQLTEDIELPPAVQQKLSQMELALNVMAEHILKQNQSLEEAQNLEALDKYMESLTQTYGLFDEQYVLTLMANGMTGDDAVRHWQNTIQGFVSKKEQNGEGPGALVPPVLGSGGAIPGGIKKEDITGASRNQTVDLVANLLKNSNLQGR